MTMPMPILSCDHPLSNLFPKQNPGYSTLLGRYIIDSIYPIIIIKIISKNNKNKNFIIMKMIPYFIIVVITLFYLISFVCLFVWMFRSNLAIDF